MSVFMILKWVGDVARFRKHLNRRRLMRHAVFEGGARHNFVNIAVDNSWILEGSEIAYQHFLQAL